jgi:hypothetical protein
MSKYTPWPSWLTASDALQIKRTLVGSGYQNVMLLKTNEDDLSISLTVDRRNMSLIVCGPKTVAEVVDYVEIADMESVARLAHVRNREPRTPE